MHFEYTAPTVAKSDKSFDVNENGKHIGSISRYFTNPQTRNPQYDINLNIHDTEGNQYHIVQHSFTMRKGGEWEIKKGEHSIGRISNPDGFFKIHQIDVKAEGFPVFSIKANFSGKGKIVNAEKEEMGETYRTTSIKRTYEGDIEDSFIGPNLPILFYGIVHVFWCGFNKE